ncbi:MAG: potassium/proton antiporter [Methanotrichaceae archaeon]
MIEYELLGISILLLLSIVASKATSRLGIPALLIFLLIGMLAGSEGPGGIYFDDPSLAQSLGIIALIFILFAGGLDTNWLNIKPVLGKGITLATLGVMLTAVLVGLFAATILGLTLLEGLLLGSIISSTDAAAVFSLLRSKQVSLKGELKPLLELESGSNDPMAIFLTSSLTSLLVNPSHSPVEMIPAFAQQMALGAIMGYLAGRAMTIIINRIRLEYDGLYPALTISLVLLSYGATAILGGSGFLAVYIAGITLGNSSFIHKKSLIGFHDGMAWIMQIVMFLTLGLLVFPSHLVPIAWTGLLISTFLMLIARPLSVFILLRFGDMPIREKAMVSWVGLRGAVPIILATIPLLARLPNADIIFNIVFFIVITSVLFQGTSIPLAAKFLKVDAPIIPEPEYLTKCDIQTDLKGKLRELKIPKGSAVGGKQIVELELPNDILIIVLKRDDKLLIPSGKTILEPEDILLVLSNADSLNVLQSKLDQTISQ